MTAEAALFGSPPNSQRFGRIGWKQKIGLKHPSQFFKNRLFKRGFSICKQGSALVLNTSADSTALSVMMMLQYHQFYDDSEVPF